MLDHPNDKIQLYSKDKFESAPGSGINLVIEPHEKSHIEKYFLRPTSTCEITDSGDIELGFRVPYQPENKTSPEIELFTRLPAEQLVGEVGGVAVNSALNDFKARVGGAPYINFRRYLGVAPRELFVMNLGPGGATNARNQRDTVTN